MTIRRSIPLAIVLLGLGLVGIYSTRTGAADNELLQTEEYLTIRWSGREHTHVIRPNGETESLGPLLANLERPDRVDERAYLMNIAINAAAKEGYQLAAMVDDRVVMKRPVRR